MYTYLMLPAAVRAEVPALAAERRERRQRRAHPHTFVLAEAFTDDGAEPHVNSDHFTTAMATMPQGLAHTPKNVSRQVDGSGWDAMGELTID